MSFPTVIYGEPGDERRTGTTVAIPIGTRMTFPNGDEFRWVNTGELLVAGYLNQGEATASPFGVDENPTVAAVAGAVTVTVDVASALTLDVLKHGVLIDETNSHSYEVQTNTIDDPTVIKLASADGLITDLATGDTVRFYKSPYMDIIKQPGPPTALCVGFTVVAVASGSYGWIKSRGFTIVLVDETTGALVVGDAAYAANVDPGSVGSEATTEQVVGVPYNIGTDNGVDAEIYAQIR